VVSFDVELLMTVCVLVALGQIMLYVDGMEGIASHSGTVQWLYTLLSSQVPDCPLLSLLGINLFTYLINSQLHKMIHRVPDK